MKLPRLNLPPLQLQLTEEQGIIKVFDKIRRKYVALTPEEYVRQHFVNWLTEGLGYPVPIVANEMSIELNGMRRRCDTVVFGRDGKPMIIVEYKAPSVKITQDTFEQIYRYNLVLHADLLIVSNGLNHYCCRIDYKANTYHFIPQIPDYVSLIYGQRLS